MDSDKVLPGFKEILSSLLNFNPYFRWSPSECLAHPIFDDLRSEQLEQQAGHKIRLDVDNDDAFDYSEGISKKYTKEDYLTILLNEAEDIHAKRLKYFKELI